MGQTTNPGRQNQSVAAMFESLQELAGDWTIQQVVVSPRHTERPGEQTAQQMVNIGRMTCRLLIGGTAILQIFQIPAAGIQFVSMITFNPAIGQFELAMVDFTSDVGILLFQGQELNTRSSEEIRATFGKVATAVRVWTLVSPTSVAPETTVQIVENEISDARWVFQLFVQGAQGNVLSQELVLTRAQPGCAAQLGCELGCAGLVGCVTGCESLQNPNGIPQNQAEVLTQAQLLAVAQLPSEAQLLGLRSAASIGQAQVETVATQCGCQAVTLQPQPLLPPPACPMAPVPPTAGQKVTAPTHGHK